MLGSRNPLEGSERLLKPIRFEIQLRKSRIDFHSAGAFQEINGSCGLSIGIE